MSSKKAWNLILENSNLIYYFMYLYGVENRDRDDCYQEVVLRLHKHLTKYNSGIEYKNILIKHEIGK